ncbi:hypothetical protein ASD11_14890 [Aeromicrobium sp. Root495]|uniref:Asp23/Gls24 family envelope stress response protein n=1 Tax=Aeromicrobium sp. Root495 TaxID=1736550 RepID=UPI0006F5DAF8|nr:Asp23/Gls24 family envelope stress response protein [Aeromicrobium sp. Root495]KQY55790.1 hypothetical protein ASD11_14890 [Aeromicrobium sp. Root495]RYJ01913.1 MAG: Asp23/Gls24 family envelope stress response protein [Actinomycetales bacterium]
MSETFALSDVPGAGADRAPEDRGTLDVKARAVESILCRAALDVDGSVAHSAGVGPLGGRNLPTAAVTFRGSIAVATLDVGAHWPCRAEELAATIRDTVRVEASRLSDTEITRVDVTLHVVPGSGDQSRPRRVL